MTDFTSAFSGKGLDLSPFKAWAIYAKLAKEHPKMIRKEFAQVVRRPNKTGIPGVTKLVKFVQGKKYVFWQATWSPEAG